MQPNHTRRYVVDDRLPPNLPQALDAAMFKPLPLASMGPDYRPGVGVATSLRVQPAQATPALAQSRGKYDISKRYSPLDPAGVANSQLKIAPGLVKKNIIGPQIIQPL